MGGAMAKLIGGGTLLLPQSERIVASHLSAAQESERIVEAARKQLRRNKTNNQGADDSNLIKNMGKLGDSISGSRTSQPMYKPQAIGHVGQADSASVRKGKKQDVPSYGINESELKSLYDHRRTLPDICTVVYLADRFRLKRSDVQLLLRYTGISGVTKPNPQIRGQMIAVRIFDQNPSI